MAKFSFYNQQQIPALQNRNSNCTFSSFPSAAGEQAWSPQGETLAGGGGRGGGCLQEPSHLPALLQEQMQTFSFHSGSINFQKALLCIWSSCTSVNIWTKNVKYSLWKTLKPVKQCKASLTYPKTTCSPEVSLTPGSISPSWSSCFLTVFLETKYHPSKLLLPSTELLKTNN